jgi:hypothetical protein
MKSIFLISSIVAVVLSSCNSGSDLTKSPIIGNSLVSSVSSKKSDVLEYEYFMKEHLASISNERIEVKNKLSNLIADIASLKKDFEVVYNEIYQSKQSVLNSLSKEEKKSVIINDNKPTLNVDFGKISSSTSTEISTDKIYKEYDLLIEKLTKRFKSPKNIELSSILESEKDIEKVETTNNSVSNNLIVLYSIEYAVAELETALAETLKYSFAYGANNLGFDKILGLAYPEFNIVNEGDDVEVMVMMAGFSSEKMPIVEPSVGIVKEVKNGVATIKVKSVKEGELKIFGKVGIADKFGNILYQPYETRVTVIKK